MRKKSGVEWEWSFLEAGERERERELFGVVDRVTGLSRVGEMRVPAPSDTTTSETCTCRREARGARGTSSEAVALNDARKGSRDSCFSFMGFV